MAEVAGRRVEAEFSWDSTAERTIAVYRGAIARHRSGAERNHATLQGGSTLQLDPDTPRP